MPLTLQSLQMASPLSQFALATGSQKIHRLHSRQPLGHHTQRSCSSTPPSLVSWEERFLISNWARQGLHLLVQPPEVSYYAGLATW